MANTTVSMLENFVAEAKRSFWAASQGEKLPDRKWIDEHLLYEVLALFKSGPIAEYKETVKRIVDGLTEDEVKRIVLRVLNQRRNHA